MGERTSIAWAHHTFNPWWGCEKVSPGCANCYAEALAGRFGTGWGGDEPRRFFGARHWREPLRWNEAARAAGERRRVFCASMADVFEDDSVHPDLESAFGMHAYRALLFRLVILTPHLDWLLLTKRPENIKELSARASEDANKEMVRDEDGPLLPALTVSELLASWPPPNVWLGASVEDQERADERVPELLRVPARVRFLSVEPLLGPVDLRRYLSGSPRIDWVIVGGES